MMLLQVVGHWEEFEGIQHPFCEVRVMLDIHEWPRMLPPGGTVPGRYQSVLVTPSG
jgi:hypothetical protein